MLRKTMMAALVAAVVAACAVPGVASAGLWKHHVSPIQQNAQIQLTGQTKFSGGLGSMDCQTTAQLTIFPNSSTGNITQWEPDLDQPGSTVTSKCVAGGFLAACQVHAIVATGLPWVVHNETQRLEITKGHVDFTFSGGFCPARKGTMTPVNAALGHTVTATPNQTKTTSSFTLSGQVLVHLYSSHTGVQPFRSETASVSGTQNILPPNVGTYSTE